MATAVTQTDARPTCPICLGDFYVPRQLPCAHSFCQNCLHSYIESKVTEYEKNRCIECPVCRQTSGHFKENKSTSEWASLFPVDTVLKSLSQTESKVDRVCDSCNFEGVSVTATGFCVICEESMCDSCLRSHRKQKMSRSHTILTIEDVKNNLQHVMKSAEGFTCFEHSDKDLEFYCNNHNIPCCSVCFLTSHKTCSNVKMMKDELDSLLHETKSSEIIEELRKLESHLKFVTDIKVSNLKVLESQVNGLEEQIREIRKKFNTALDELEMKVLLEGRRIQKEVVIKTQEENHQCFSLIHAIKNSQLLCETTHKYGNDTQKFLTTSKLKSQLPLYYSQVREKYERTETLTLNVKLTQLLESILLLLSSDVGKLVTTTGTALSIPGVRKPKKLCQVEKVETFNVNIIGGLTMFIGVAFLPRDRVMLVDYNNDQCILLNNLHQVVTTYKLKDACDICVLGDEEVAVTVRNKTSIEILSVRDDVIKLVRTITTKYKCEGITSAGNGEIVVVGDCGKNKSCFSLIRDGVEVRYSDQYDSGGGRSYIAINSSKTRVYVTASGEDCLHCFNMEGKLQYTYSHDNLKCPLGVAVDRDDNIYVVGSDSHNIHQLSPEGCNLQVITVGVPRDPWVVSFDNNRDIFMITSSNTNNTIHIYQLKGVTYRS